MITARRFEMTRRGVLAAASASALHGSSRAQARMAEAVCWRAGGSLPFPVQEIYPCVHDGRIWVGGGLIGESGRVIGASDRLVSCEPSAEGWRRDVSLPGPVHHPQLASVGGSLWLLGGFQSPGPGVTWRMSNAAWRLDSHGGRWVPGPAAPAPHAECVCIVLNDLAHLVGGRRPSGASNLAYRDHVDTSDHLVFDPASGAWSTAAPALTSRNSAAGVELSGRLHVVGGRSVTDGPSVSHEVYDPREDRWRLAAPLPREAAAGGLAAAVLAGRIYVFGGEVFDPPPGGVLRGVWVYDPGADLWEKAGDMPTPRHGLGAVAFGSEVWTLGGAERPSGTNTSAHVEIMRPVC
ncbi:MAG: galactose oxidase [Alphaproteobacteria bacterium]|nr:galactose oxidase [Alphaproteobacteria bacterium]